MTNREILETVVGVIVTAAAVKAAIGTLATPIKRRERKPAVQTVAAEVDDDALEYGDLT